MRNCEICLKDKDESEFPVLTRNEAGIPKTFRKLCKPCYAAKRSTDVAYKERANAREREKTKQKQAQSEEAKGVRTCKNCNITKALTSEFYAEVKTVIDGKEYFNFRKDCRDCCNKKRRDNREYKEVINKRRKNPEVREKRNFYKRTEKCKETARRRDKIRRETEILFRLKKNLRNRTRQALLRTTFEKEQSLYDYLGCTIEFFQEHMEKQFEPWMSWDNYGNERYINWNIDHIIPLSSATTLDELYKLCHYTNCRPLRVIDNMLKSDEIDVF